MRPISLYWFAAQQQTITLRPQNSRYFYVKFSAKSNGLGLFILTRKVSGQKMAQNELIRETAKWRRSKATS